MSSRATNVLGCILAGGAGRRLGGRDKGLIELDGRPLVEHCRDRLAPQVDAMLVSANRHQAWYRRFVPRVVGDDDNADGDAMAGPLAGMLAAMRAAPQAMIVCVPCDSPFFPRDLVQRLRAALGTDSRTIAVARTPARLQPVFALFRPGLAAEVRFTFRSDEDSPRIQVPAFSVNEDREGRYVYVVEPGVSGTATVARRLVTIGEISEDGIEIFSGLEDGDRVVTAGMSQLVDGQMVKFEEDQSE